MVVFGRSSHRGEFAQGLLKKVEGPTLSQGKVLRGHSARRVVGTHRYQRLWGPKGGRLRLLPQFHQPTTAGFVYLEPTAGPQLEPVKSGDTIQRMVGPRAHWLALTRAFIYCCDERALSFESSAGAGQAEKAERHRWVHSCHCIETFKNARALSAKSPARALSEEPGLAANQCQKLGLGGQTHVLTGTLSAAKNHDCRHPSHTKFASRQRRLVNIQLSYDTLSAQFISNLIDDRCQLAAGAAPARGEIDQDWLVGLEDFLFKVEIIEDLYVFGCHNH